MPRSPELFGLTDATSNVGWSGSTTDVWARSRDVLNGQTSNGPATASRHVVAISSCLHRFVASATWFFMVHSIPSVSPRGYSWRRATNRLTSLARRAGTYEASIATVANSMATAAY